MDGDWMWQLIWVKTVRNSTIISGRNSKAVKEANPEAIILASITATPETGYRGNEWGIPL